MAENFVLSINANLSFAEYKEACAAKMTIIHAMETVLEHPLDYAIIKKMFDITVVEDKKYPDIDEWISNFDKTAPDKIDHDALYDFACALCDDIPLGYEASHRLAHILFSYLNSNK